MFRRGLVVLLPACAFRMETWIAKKQAPHCGACSMFTLEATGGFEPPNGGFANLCLRPLGYVADFWCRGRDSNPHALTSTAPSTLLVYQFQHLGSGTCSVKRVAGAEGLEPPAFGFGDRRSSQLSYAPTVPAHYSTVEVVRAARFADSES